MTDSPFQRVDGLSVEEKFALLKNNITHNKNEHQHAVLRWIGEAAFYVFFVLYVGSPWFFFCCYCATVYGFPFEHSLPPPSQNAIVPKYLPPLGLGFGEKKAGWGLQWEDAAANNKIGFLLSATNNARACAVVPTRWFCYKTAYSRVCSDNAPFPRDATKTRLCDAAPGSERRVGGQSQPA